MDMEIIHSVFSFLHKKERPVFHMIKKHLFKKTDIIARTR